jgi:predicted anti-sigma-YlaC factor YlaD
LEKTNICREVERNLVNIAENRMDDEILDIVQGHLAACRRCACLCQQFSRTWQNIALQNERPSSPSFFSDLMKRVLAYDEKPSRWKDVIVSLRRFLRPAVAVLLLVAGILAGYEMGNVTRKEPRPEDPFVGQLLGSFEDIPQASVADFYIGRQFIKKAKLK